MLTFALTCLYLPIPTFIVGALAGGEGSDAAVIYYVPFAASCMLAAFAIIVFWSHAGTNRELSADERHQWRRRLLAGWPVTAPRYWARFH